MIRCLPPMVIVWGLLVAPISAIAQVRHVVHVSGLNAPVEMVQHPTNAAVQFVVQQGGLVRVVQNGAVLPTPFLDLSAVIATGGERGLLGMALPPDFSTSGRVFVNFTNVSGATVVARFKVGTDPLRIDPSSRFDLRWGGSGGSRFITQPFSNHNGGHLAFGGDGFLYIGMGDGGSSGDPGNRAQDPTTLLGKMLRIDVNVPDAHSEGYVVPDDNPFVGGRALPEIWAFGLRNPWKFTFDATGPGGPGTQALLIGDVGQGAREEINYEPAGRGGRNYGWRLREGTVAYLPDTPTTFRPLTEPILDYPRSEGQSVTGGYVYRGTALRSGFRGRYFFADFVSGRIWSLGLAVGADGGATVVDRLEHTSELGGAAVLGNIAAMGVDSQGELYVLSFNGTIIKIVHNPDASGPIAGTPGAGTTLSPFGQVDTPANNATGLVGAIGITGWALDDAGVAHVRIYRNCVTGVDTPASCQPLLGVSVVFVGQAAFLPGARPDVEAAFPAYPNAGRAGWGMQILSPMLPHIPTEQSSGGQGSFTLYAVATDQDGHVKLLGRSYVEGSSTYATPTAVTFANDTIAKPFGTIDTPALGATVSGEVANFGWVLTPDTNTVADGPADILIPVNGSTMVVYIDGVPRATVLANQCRGTVGNPVSSGLFCDDDVANIFGTTSPQPPLSPRTSNPTRFRNLDAERGAIGSFVLDTTTLANGLHTIAWGVEDSSGRTEGIGSRFFTVSNTGADQSAPRASSVTRSSDESAAVSDVRARTGFGLSTPWQTMHADASGTRHARLPEMGRIELRFGVAPDSAHLEAHGTVRPLPVGSSLEGQNFSWAPAPGHVGTYDLTFLRDGVRTVVSIDVVPPRRVSDASPMMMALDAVRVVNDRRLRVDGWAFDLEAELGSGVGAVHVWAQSASGAVFLGGATLGAPRPDVASTNGPLTGHAGFTLASDVPLIAGTYTVTAYVWLERTGRWEDARSVVVHVR